jgi:hypothetical protein
MNMKSTLKRILTGASQRYDDPVVNSSASEFEVNNWIISDFVCSRLVPVVGSHPFPLNELMLMSATVCRFRPEYIFEWGTHVGKSARVFYETAKAFSVPTNIHSIDLPDDVFHNEHPKEGRGHLVKGLKGVILHQADGLSKSLELVKDLAPKGATLFFVDGDHSYESVKRELSAILQQVAHPVVLLHDTFYQSEEAGYNVGPYKAIEDVLASQGSGWKKISTNTGLPGMTLIYKHS